MVRTGSWRRCATSAGTSINSRSVAVVVPPFSRVACPPQAMRSDTHIPADSVEHKDAKRDENFAVRQRALLLNEKNRDQGGESEFYVFRYRGRGLPARLQLHTPAGTGLCGLSKQRTRAYSAGRAPWRLASSARAVRSTTTAANSAWTACWQSHFSEGFHQLKDPPANGLCLLDDRSSVANVVPNYQRHLGRRGGGGMRTWWNWTRRRRDPTSASTARMRTACEPASSPTIFWLMRRGIAGTLQAVHEIRASMTDQLDVALPPNW